MNLLELSVYDFQADLLEKPLRDTTMVYNPLSGDM